MAKLVCITFVARDPTNRVKAHWLRFPFARLRTKQSAFFHICETIHLLDGNSLKFYLRWGMELAHHFSRKFRSWNKFGLLRILICEESAEKKS